MSFLRSFIDTSTAILCSLKRHRRLSIEALDQPVKVNLGCGLTVAPGWLNIDGSINAMVACLPTVFQKIAYRLSGARKYYSAKDYQAILTGNKFIHHNLEYGIPLADECADFVYSSHLLEHLSKESGMNLIKEIFRILKIGGRMRIVVPDLEYAVRLYDKGEKKRMLDDFFFVDHQRSYFARHKYMYDFELLRELLELVGFRDVSQFNFREGMTPDIPELDNQPDISLYVEAKKL